ncbi:MAG: hypothetical protein ACLPQS_14025 [Acidimicrobiales bacterium]
MVPSVYTGFFTAASAAAGSLIGLLFVAISLNPESIFGENSTAQGRSMAGGAFIGLVNVFLMSLVALIPNINLGAVGAGLALVALLATLILHRRLPRSELHLTLLALSVVAFVAQLAAGTILLLRPHDRSLVGSLAALSIASLSVSLARAWALMQGRHLRSAPSISAAAASEASFTPEETRQSGQSV